MTGNPMAAKKPVKKKAPAKRKRASAAPATAATSGTPLAPGLLLVNMIPRSLSNETEQDSEPTVAVNPSNPQQIAATAFTPDPFGGANAPIYVSSDGGATWALRSNVPSDSVTQDITIAFSGKGGNLYGGMLKIPGTLLLNILRTGDAFSTTPMTTLVSRRNVDQPYVRAINVKGTDRVYIGDNDLSQIPRGTATVEQSLNGNTFASIRIERRATGSAEQDGPQIRPAVHADGTVYVAFNGWRAYSDSNEVTADIVVVRDDKGGASAQPFSDLVDKTDELAGMRVARGVRFIWDDRLGNQRLNGDIAITLDPRNSAIVYVAWADVQPNTGYTLHLRRSTDRGVTWSTADLRTVARATNPALAINNKGLVAFLYQHVTGTGASQRWVTQIDRSKDGVNWNSMILATVPANTPAPQFQPYIGDYIHLQSVGSDFYGIFSTNNSPDATHFPSGVTYQRNADFATRRLLGTNGTSTVAVSIDPFFFKLSG
jgi:hypothetical protein